MGNRQKNLICSLPWGVTISIFHNTAFFYEPPGWTCGIASRTEGLDVVILDSKSPATLRFLRGYAYVRRRFE